ncbi:MAG: FAD-dependent oxidoreductase, partial [Actinomycetota bacterium]|nr:FAD-dependent oxidoreductase [Actinomycetota bacterium]
MSIDDNTIDQRHLDAIANADHVPYWLDGAHAPDTNATLVRTESCDLCVVGGGYTGLWTAIIAKERDASRDVVLIDSGPVGGAASGRNGGFMDASLTHGISNGFRHFPDDIEVLEELGMKNLDDIELALQRYGIECDYHRNGVIEVVAQHHPSSYEIDLHEEFDLLRRL